MCVETPMTLCCSVVVKCRNMLLALYAGGAFVDYRNREGLTPMHRAAEKGNSVAIKVKYTTCIAVASHPLFLTRVVYCLLYHADPAGPGSINQLQGRT